FGVHGDGIEVPGPADLRPVVGFDFAQDAAPALRRRRDQAVVRARVRREKRVRGPEQRIGVRQAAGGDDAAVGDVARVGYFAVEALEGGGGEVGERGDA